MRRIIENVCNIEFLGVERIYNLNKAELLELKNSIKFVEKWLDNIKFDVELQYGLKKLSKIEEDADDSFMQDQ